MLERFVYYRPRSSDEVTGLLDEFGDMAWLHAGGTDLIVQMRAGVVRPRHVIDLNEVEGLREVEGLPNNGGLRIGAGVTMGRLRFDKRIRVGWPALAEGAAEVGSRQIQNRATLIGNVCNASPAADTVPALFLYGASLNIQGPEGRRTISIEEFAVGPRRTALQLGEWVTSVDIPRGPSRSGSAYVKLGRSPGVDLALVGVACLVSPQQTRLALASVAPTVRRALATERLLEDSSTFPEEAATVLRDEIAPIDDVRASADYRRTMASKLARRAWERARASSDSHDH